MKETRADLWEVEADLRVITTNGTVRADGCLVMGRGCAWEAKERYPGLDKSLGGSVHAEGNIALWNPRTNLITFPVKHNWWEKADIALIEESARDLVGITDLLEEIWGRPLKVVVPRPGCGNGGLEWEDVKPVIEPLLDDRFTVVTK